MRKTVLILLVTAAAALASDSAVSPAPAFGPPAESLRLARYFAGAVLLRTVPNISDSARAVHYRELEAVTGVSAAEARSFLAGCKSDPARWKDISELAVSILTAVSDNAGIPGIAPGMKPGANINVKKEKKRTWAGL